jgi:hypothetical protein
LTQSWSGSTSKKTFESKGASIATSLILEVLDKTLFVGQWAPTMLILGLYNKLVKQHGSAQYHA